MLVGKIKDLEENLEEKEELAYLEQICVPIDDESYLLLDGYIVRVKELGIDMRSGVIYTMYDYGEFEADWALTAIYSEKAEPRDYLYFEQGGYEVALHNFLRTSGKGTDVSELDYLIEFDDE